MSQRVTLAQALEFAVQHHNAGRLAEAEEIYTQILAAVPDNHDALHLLGLVANERGDNERAAELIQRAIDIAPDVGEMHGNLALVLQDLGRLKEAATRFEHALSLSPGFVEGHNNLGLVLQELGQLADAVAHFENALQIGPEFAEAHSNLGNALRESGRLEEAISHHRRAIDLAPGFAEAHNNLGSALQAKGQVEEAAACFEKALSLNGDYAEAHCNLGSVWQETGQLNTAIACYRKALATDPSLARAHANLGAALLEAGDVDKALDSLRKATTLAPKTDTYWAGFAACIQRVRFESIDGRMRVDLLQLLDNPAVDPMTITPALLTAVQPAFDQLDPAILSEDALLLRAMTLNAFKDRQIEEAMIRLRRNVLDTALSTPNDQSGLPFAGALAQHCFLNEYIFQPTPEERERVATLEAGIAAALKQDAAISPLQIAALASYEPLFAFAWATQLQRKAWPDSVQSIVTQQISEPFEEQRVQDRISQLTPIVDSVSQEVQTQYEENPYPRWTKFASPHRPEQVGDILRGAPLRFSIGDYRSPEAPDVLIAGCGTGQQSLLAASRYANANILAVDLSRASLAYAWRKTKERGIENIDYAQADILALDGLKRKFDLIECVGVLHHLADPLAGWHILTDLLRPGGLMKIGLYSEAARADVVAARALVAEQQNEATTDGIRRCREAIAARADSGDALMASITERSSFYATSEFRDLVFHVQEHRFTLPQIDNALRSLGLTFLGFELADPETLRAFKAAHGDAAADLARWHEFETANPDTFRAMYQFWVQKR